MSVWANHAHVFPAEVREDGTVDRLLKLMDQCEIEKAVAFAPFADQVRGLDVDPNEWLAQQLQGREDRLFGFGTVDFAAGRVAEQVERARELGMRGLKLHPPMQNVHILSEPMHELYEKAQELGLFLTFHTGVHWSRLSNYRTLDFDEIAFLYPRLRFSLEHVGGYAFFRETIAVMHNHGQARANGELPTVYAGLTTVFSPAAPHWYLEPSAIEELVFRVGGDKIIFGLDFPYNDAEYTRDAIGIIRNLRIAEQDKTAILGGTLRKLLD